MEETLEREDTAQAGTSLSRRKFITSLGLAGAAAGINPLVTLADEEPLAWQTGEIMKCKPYLQAVQLNSAVVRWITNVRTYSWVEYGESPDMLNQRAQTVTDGLVQANNTIHNIVLKNLQPGKTYYYKAVSKRVDHFTAGKIAYAETAESKVYAFKTPVSQAGKAEFLVFNDVHDRPETFGHMMQYASATGKDFVLLNGDIFSSLKDGEDQIVAHLLQPVTNLFATQTPFIYSRGNHEARGEYCRQLPDYVNGREHKFYYSFQLGPMYAIVLDSGEDKEDNHPAYGGILDFDDYRMEQKVWLEQEVRKPAFRKAKYKVVFVHIPPYYTANKDAHGTTACRELWVPVLNKANIDLMICGHTHRYKIRTAVTGQHNFPIVIGGGPKDGERTVIAVKADSNALNLTMLDDSGKTVGTLTL
ncbi:metallophosphoesterase family protein [Pedobacter sp. BS3]|uniref:purple acid phosphatase family protein n=1 Tax=Pedobacter sp. BS3 TaxID=2567937 RepID=UPI0011EEE107|nr:metallophosphoesterase family protein [Pedobacter sp. BS3]TZF81154.1 metallophosphoesterase family protein [Pedobacter sp. BS3]